MQGDGVRVEANFSYVRLCEERGEERRGKKEKNTRTML